MSSSQLAMGQNQVPLVNIPKMNRIVFMGMFTYPFLVTVGIDPPPIHELIFFRGVETTNQPNNDQNEGKYSSTMGASGDESAATSIGTRKRIEPKDFCEDQSLEDFFF